MDNVFGSSARGAKLQSPRCATSSRSSRSSRPAPGPSTSLPTKIESDHRRRTRKYFSASLQRLGQHNGLIALRLHRRMHNFETFGSLSRVAINVYGSASAPERAANAGATRYYLRLESVFQTTAKIQSTVRPRSPAWATPRARRSRKSIPPTPSESVHALRPTRALRSADRRDQRRLYKSEGRAFDAHRKIGARHGKDCTIRPRQSDDGRHETRHFLESPGPIFDRFSQTAQGVVPLVRDLRQIAPHLLEPFRLQAPDVFAAAAFAADRAASRSAYSAC